ncbi:L,D-transpeptidase family protein [Rhizobium laguerreae]|uniref:L,D-transpeptidase family protein n=1 Tax=Rhizobium laguerreae TaxID=1076926 RepID=UPI001441506E|nr:L,D-transpeptidase family protein [Rhizobium laguerreae]NKM67669.1 L,D-transpeptidase family protein [Rhizobium laguerreae]
MITNLRWIAPLAAGLFLLPTTASVAYAKTHVADGLAKPDSVAAYNPPDVRPIHILRKSRGSLATFFDTLSRRNEKLLQGTMQVSASANNDIATALEEYYSNPKALPIWIDDKGPNAKALGALRLLEQAEDWGLSAADYRVEIPSGKGDQTQELAVFEVTLSNKLLMFLQDNYRGRIDPNRLSTYYDFKRKSFGLEATLVGLAATRNLSEITSRLLPSDPKFRQLAQELKVLRSSNRGGDTSTNINKVVVAMEEIRWLPHELPDRYVLVNQPAYTAYYYDEGRTVLAIKAVIGQQNHQTNVFNASIKTIEFNPVWGVPQSIIHNEMLQHLRHDPAYLDKEGYKVSVKGVYMASSKVDWSQPLKNIGVVQPPGPDNALGRLKILFPNSHAIYMHDTPSRGRFASQDRMFSHWCIRLENPRAMAAALMKTSLSSIDKQIETGTKTDVSVPEEVPVFISYFTAWPSDDGIVHFYDDIYGRDEATLKAIQATSTDRSRS